MDPDIKDKGKKMQKDDSRPITGHMSSFSSAASSSWMASEPRGSTPTPERRGLQRKGEGGKQGCRSGDNLS